MGSKSTPEEIRTRFDNDVDRFSKLETGQTSTVDAALVLDLITTAAAASTPHAESVLDLGCGAGNFTLKLLQHLPHLRCTLVDLSLPMLQRAQERIQTATTAIQGDLRAADLGRESYDIVLAAAVLHHLRSRTEWKQVCAKLFTALRPNGTLWIFDLVSHEISTVQQILWDRYGDYLAELKGDDYRDHVFRYIEQEDSPVPITEQCELLRAAGFREIDILHKNTCFAALGARKPATDANGPRPIAV